MENCAEEVPVSVASDNKENVDEPPRKRSKKETHNDSILDIERQKIQYLKEKAERKERPEDDDLLFFKSLLPYVKNIPNHMKLRFRSHINSVVEQYAVPISEPVLPSDPSHFAAESFNTSVPHGP